MAKPEIGYSMDIPRLDQGLFEHIEDNRYNTIYTGHSRLVDWWIMAGLIKFFCRPENTVKTSFIANTEDYNEGMYNSPMGIYDNKGEPK